MPHPRWLASPALAALRLAGRPLVALRLAGRPLVVRALAVLALAAPPLAAMTAGCGERPAASPERTSATATPDAGPANARTSGATPRDAVVGGRPLTAPEPLTVPEALTAVERIGQAVGRWSGQAPTVTRGDETTFVKVEQGVTGWAPDPGCAGQRKCPELPRWQGDRGLVVALAASIPPMGGAFSIQEPLGPVIVHGAVHAPDPALARRLVADLRDLVAAARTTLIVTEHAELAGTEGRTVTVVGVAEAHKAGVHVAGASVGDSVGGRYGWNGKWLRCTGVVRSMTITKDPNEGAGDTPIATRGPGTYYHLEDPARPGEDPPCVVLGRP